jgi:hypothetical protein
MEKGWNKIFKLMKNQEQKNEQKRKTLVILETCQYPKKILSGS